MRINIGGTNIKLVICWKYTHGDILIWQNQTATIIINWCCTCCSWSQSKLTIEGCQYKESVNFYPMYRVGRPISYWIDVVIDNKIDS